METTTFSGDDELHTSTSSISHSLTLSCGEHSLNSTLADDDPQPEGDETPSKGGCDVDSSLSESTTWGEGSGFELTLSPSPSPSMSSSLSSLSTSAFLEDLSVLGSVLSDDIYQETRRKEAETPPIEIDQEYHKTRPVLVDWILDVGDYFGFHGATTHLAVAYLDQMLAKLSIERNKLQLVATACLLIAGTQTQRNATQNL
jgi:hypothetical protein